MHGLIPTNSGWHQKTVTIAKHYSCLLNNNTKPAALLFASVGMLYHCDVIIQKNLANTGPLIATTFSVYNKNWLIDGRRCLVLKIRDNSYWQCTENLLIINLHNELLITTNQSKGTATVFLWHLTAGYGITNSRAGAKQLYFQLLWPSNFSDGSNRFHEYHWNKSRRDK